MGKKHTIKINQEDFTRNPNKFTVDVSGIKQRKTWEISPVERVHSPRKKKTETRGETKQKIRKALRGDLD